MGPRVLWWLLFVSVCVQLAHGPTGSVVAVVSVCVCVQLTHGPAGSVVAVACVCDCVQLTHGPTGSVVAGVSVCAADPWAQDGSVVVVCVCS